MYLLVYYNTSKYMDINTHEPTEYIPAYTSSNNTIFYGTLHVMLATISDIDDSISVISDIEIHNSDVAYTLKSSYIDEKSAIITFVDVNNNFGITALLARVIIEGSGKGTTYSLYIGGITHMSSGQSLGTVANGITMDYDVITYAADRNGNVRFALLYSDISNYAKITASFGQVMT
jgi:hypothetical protein